MQHILDDNPKSTINSLICEYMLHKTNVVFITLITAIAVILCPVCYYINTHYTRAHISKGHAASVSLLNVHQRSESVFLIIKSNEVSFYNDV